MKQKDIRKCALSTQYERIYTKGKGTIPALSHREFFWKQQVYRVKQWCQRLLKLSWITRAGRQKNFCPKCKSMPKSLSHGCAKHGRNKNKTFRMSVHLPAHSMCLRIARTELVFVPSVLSNVLLGRTCHSGGRGLLWAAGQHLSQKVTIPLKNEWGILQYCWRLSNQSPCAIKIDWFQGEYNLPSPKGYPPPGPIQ